MADSLMFRFPGRSINVLGGTFREVLNWNDLRGFVLSSFDKDKLYHFEPGKEPGNLFLNEAQVPCMSEREYSEVAHHFRAELSERDLHKAVFSRVKVIPFERNPQQFFFQLVDLYPEAFVYLLSSEALGTWIGATPEILLTSVGEEACTMALAGTLPSDDEGTWGRKELEEQEHVRNYIRTKLCQAEVKDFQESTRSEFVAGPVKHLVSKFSFKFQSDKLVDLALSLHPTPAVSGLPVDEAVQLIRECEPHSRSLYAGIIGWLGEEESQLYVNLRCGRIMESTMLLYLGGGFTVDSDIEKEWMETENKARTLLNVIEGL